MNRIFSCCRICLFVSLCGSLCLGCGKTDSVPETVPVSGKVTVDGQPLTEGQVSYLGFDKEQVVGGICTGTIDSTGGYVMRTGGKDGVPPGPYKATVTLPMVPTGDTKRATTPFDSKFSNAATTKLIVNVVANAAPGTYDLKLTK